MIMGWDKETRKCQTGNKTEILFLVSSLTIVCMSIHLPILFLYTLQAAQASCIFPGVSSREVYFLNNCCVFWLEEKLEFLNSISCKVTVDVVVKVLSTMIVTALFVLYLDRVVQPCSHRYRHFTPVHLSHHL